MGVRVGVGVEAEEGVKGFTVAITTTRAEVAARMFILML